MTEPDGLDGLERLDPALRAIAMARTDFSLNSIRLMREPFNQRRREAAEHTDAQGVRIVDDTVVAESGSVAVRIYSRAEANPAPAIVYCHAGGFRAGKPGHRSPAVRGAARRGRCTVVSVDYRLAPGTSISGRPRRRESPCCDGWRRMRRNWASTLPRLAAGGSSAGATLTACLALRYRRWLTAGGRIPAAAPAGAGRSGNRVEGRVLQPAPAFDSERSGSDVAYTGPPAAGSVAAVPARRRPIGCPANCL